MLDCILFVCGMSGAGKTTVQSTFEDMGYMCIDNMPVNFISLVIDLTQNQEQELQQKLVFIFDFKYHRAVDILKIFSEIKQQFTAGQVDLLFLDTSDSKLLKRYKETRRRHPFSNNGQIPLTEAISKERRFANKVKDAASLIIDTTNTSVKQLQQKLNSIFNEKGTADIFTIQFMSFGFKYGIPQEADFVLDVRYLPNPFYIDELKTLTGLDEAVSLYVQQSVGAQELFEKTKDYLIFLLKNYKKEERNNIVVAVGCTGGQHRSVVLAEYLYTTFKKKYISFVQHRDMEKNQREVIERYRIK